MPPIWSFIVNVRPASMSYLPCSLLCNIQSWLIDTFSSALRCVRAQFTRLGINHHWWSRGTSIKCATDMFGNCFNRYLPFAILWSMLLDAVGHPGVSCCFVHTILTWQFCDHYFYVSENLSMLFLYDVCCLYCFTVSINLLKASQDVLCPDHVVKLSSLLRLVYFLLVTFGTRRKHIESDSPTCDAESNQISKCLRWLCPFRCPDPFSRWKFQITRCDSTE